MSYELEPVECCPVCGEEGKFEFTQPPLELDIELSVYYCPECQCSYHNPRMTAESMHEYYRSGDYATEHKKNNIGEMNRAKKRTQLVKNLKLRDYTRALDVGCAQGYLLAKLEELYPGLETVGYDIYVDDNAVREIVTDRDEIEGPFDWVSCMHVLEHVNDPKEFLSWMGSLLETDGVLVIEVPTKREIFLPHPIIYSKKSYPLLLEYAGITNYTYVATSDIAILIGIK